MRILDKDRQPVVLALGYFDSVHVGHREVILTAKRVAEQLKSKLVVFTFDGNLRAVIGKDKKSFVFSSKEREKLILSLGVDKVYFAPLTKEFLSLTKREFLNFLNELYNVKCYVSGSDYRFGKGAEGSVEYLREFAKEKKQKVITTPDVMCEGFKVSTTRVKEFLEKGDVKAVNKLLGTRYFVSGKVIHDRGVGRTLGYPTANVKVLKEKQTLRFGVYKGRVIVDGREYLAVINYGNRPTFNNENVVLEGHLIGYSGNLYDKEITFLFDDFIRDVKTFSSKEELIKQLEKDIEIVVNKND